jgi:hypothetical protein
MAHLPLFTFTSSKLRYSSESVSLYENVILDCVAACTYAKVSITNFDEIHMADLHKLLSSRSGIGLIKIILMVPLLTDLRTGLRLLMVCCGETRGKATTWETQA